MRTLFYLSESQMERISPFFPRSHGIPRADGRHVVSGILYVIKHGLQWKDAPAEYGPYKTLYNRFVRLSRLGVFSRIFTELANQTPFDGSLMIDSTHLKAHRTAASLRKKGLRASHRPDKGRIEFQTPCGLRRTWAACSAFADRRTGQRLQGSGHSPAPSSRRRHLSGRRRV